MPNAILAGFVCFAVIVSTLAGSGAAGSDNGAGTQASFKWPVSVTISHSGTFALVAEQNGLRVRFIDLVTSQVTTLAGSGNNAFADGVGTLASFTYLQGIAISRTDSFALVADNSHRVRHIVIATGVVTTLTGNGTAGSVDGVGTLATFNEPRGIALSPDGSYALITDRLNYRVRRLDMASKAVTTVAGSTDGFADGTGTNAKFRGWMFHIAIDPAGSYALICDLTNYRIRRLDIASSQVSTLAGSGAISFQDGIGTNAIFNLPNGVSIDPSGTFALVVDYGNQRIRRIVVATAQVTTLAGTGALSAVNGAGAQATFNLPYAIDIDASGTFALVADGGNHRIRRIALSSPPCSAGFYCPAASSSATQVACSISTMCPPASGSPQPCAAGMFCNATGMSVGIPCTAGFYCPPMSNSTQGSGPCPAGYYCLPRQDRLSCGAGTFSSSGQSICSDCSAGMFQKYAGQSNCITCARGTVSASRAQFCTGAWLNPCMTSYCMVMSNMFNVIASRLLFSSLHACVSHSNDRMRRHHLPFGQCIAATASIGRELLCHGQLPGGLCVGFECCRVWMHKYIQFDLVRVQGCSSRR
jgi:DNA-binding beta-propeller fold protein YncE